jgi:haloalkane dehalogenase
MGWHWQRPPCYVWLVCPLEWRDRPEPARRIIQAMRSPAGEETVLGKNVFVEGILPLSVLRKLTA